MLPKLLRAEKDKVVERKNNMSKYNLTDILNEYIGGGRIGTLRISYKDLVDKMDELEKSGKVIVREIPGPSGDRKTNREFEVVDRDSAVPGGRKQERGFTVYDYKFGFDPGDQDNFTEEYDFSVGGNDLQLAMDLIDGVKPYRFDENIKEDEFDEARQAAIESSQRAAGIKEGYIGDENYEDQKGTADQKLWVLTKLIDAGILKNPSSEYSKALKAVEHPDADMAAKEMGENINANRREKNPEGIGQLYVQPSVQKAVKFHFDAYDKGDIDVEDMIQAIEDIIFGYVKAPGMREEDAIEDEPVTEDKEKDLINALRFQVMTLEKGIIDKDDFINAVEELAFGQRRGPMQEEDVDEVMGVDRKGRKKPDYKSNLTNIDEADNMEVVALLNNIRKHLNDKFDRKYSKSEIDLYMDSLKRDIKRGEFDEVKSMSMEDHEENFENYIADRLLQEHFQRFM